MRTTTTTRVRVAADPDAAVVAAIHNSGIAERQATFEAAELLGRRRARVARARP
jgi:hypothetical protein